MDVNVSVRKKGEKTLRNKIEIKNMNSFTFMELAIKSEIKRQIYEYTSKSHLPIDEIISQATYRWDPEAGETKLMRRKETADDYRYFPEPDLVPIILTDDYIDTIRQSLPELPLQRERRYVRDLNLSLDSAFLITSDKLLADYFEDALKTCSNGRSLCNWILSEFAGRLKDAGKNIMTFGIPALHVASLINLIDKGTITGKIAKDVADAMIKQPGVDPADIVKANPDYQPLQDTGEIEKLVDAVLKDNPQSVVDYKAGRDKAFAFLVGQVMKLCKGKASPSIVNELLKKKIQEG